MDTAFSSAIICNEQQRLSPLTWPVQPGEPALSMVICTPCVNMFKNDMLTQAQIAVTTLHLPSHHMLFLQSVQEGRLNRPCTVQPHGLTAPGPSHQLQEPAAFQATLLQRGLPDAAEARMGRGQGPWAWCKGQGRPLHPYPPVREGRPHGVGAPSLQRHPDRPGC